MSLDIDWPLTLQWLTFWNFVLAFLALAAGTIAAVYAVRSFRLQRRQEDVSAAGVEVLDPELQLLRLIWAERGLQRSFYNRGSQSVACWRLRKSLKYVANQEEVPSNAWFFQAIEAASAHGLASNADGFVNQTDEGRAVVRVNRDRVIEELPLTFYP